MNPGQPPHSDFEQGTGHTTRRDRGDLFRHTRNPDDALRRRDRHSRRGLRRSRRPGHPALPPTRTRRADRALGRSHPKTDDNTSTKIDGFGSRRRGPVNTGPVERRRCGRTGLLLSSRPLPRRSVSGDYPTPSGAGLGSDSSRSRTKISAEMSGSRLASERNALTVRPVAPSTTATNRSRIAR